MEYVDVLDSSGRPIGKMKPKSEVHRDGDWHGAAHLWILNREGQILIQRRSPTKENWPRILQSGCRGKKSGIALALGRAGVDVAVKLPPER
jgi:8-oxo-dGTP diphosphatase